MDEIVLNRDLKFVLATLEISERGELLTALLEGVYSGDNPALCNVYQYIMKLQEDRLQKKQHMRELSAKGVAARRAQKASQSSADQAVNRRLSRKEAKETEFKNKYNLNLFSQEQISPVLRQKTPTDFVPPSVEEVKHYISVNQLKVDADTFVNFYESHGWMVGSTPIKSWQATAKLWHARAQNAGITVSQTDNDDENYWHALKKRVPLQATPPDMLQQPLSLSAKQNLPPDMHLDEEQLITDNSSPFARFMHRVEKYDINRENNND